MICARLLKVLKSVWSLQSPIQQHADMCANLRGVMKYKGRCSKLEICPTRTHLGATTPHRRELLALWGRDAVKSARRDSKHSVSTGVTACCS